MFAGLRGLGYSALARRFFGTQEPVERAAILPVHPRGALGLFVWLSSRSVAVRRVGYFLLSFLVGACIVAACLYDTR